MDFSFRGGRLMCGDRTYIMGILNVTPDSFSDGGRYVSVGEAVARAKAMVQDGADIIDVGGESTRPGHRPVSEELELSRVLPVIEALGEEDLGVPISCDTTKAGVARAALEAGCSIINDIWGLQGDPDMAGVAARFGAGVVAMHNQEGTSYGDFNADLLAFFRRTLAIARQVGLSEERVVLDPGIGFGKTAAQNYDALRALPVLSSLGRPLLVGPSRKSFLGAVTGRPADGRLLATAGAVASSVFLGADVVRVHDVAEMADVVKVVDEVIRKS